MRAIALDVLKRLSTLFLILVGILTLIFAIPRFAPGGPERALIGWPFTAERASLLRAHYGFDRPLAEQYLLWLQKLMLGEWGISKFTGRPIMRELELTLPLTLKLLAETLAIAVLVGVLLAMLIAYPWDRPYQGRGQGIRVLSIGLPDFYFGILVKFFFVWHLEWFPLGGFAFFAERPWQAYRQLLLPALSVGLLYGMIIGPRVASRLTAEAGSADEGSLPFAFANSGSSGRQFGKTFGYSLLVLLEYGAALVGSVVLAEKIFSIPGFGDFGVESFVRRDYPKIQAFLVVIVGGYAVIRVVVTTIEAALQRRLVRRSYRVLHEPSQKSKGRIGALVMQDGFFLGAVLVIAFAVTTLFAPHVAPFLPDEVHMKDRLLAPTTQYWMGSDLLGRDILSRVIYGGRYSLLIAAAGATGALLLGFVLGGLPRLAHGIGVALATPLIGILDAFPPLVLGMLMMTLFAQGDSCEIIALAAGLAPQIAALCLQARAEGISRVPIPYGVLAAAWLSALGMAITLEATLNFLDIGLLPLIPNWGGDLKANLPYLHSNPAIVLFPGMAVVVAALGVNLMAESLRKH
ncbi:MAG: hypothetical protein HYZ81_13790, partial [Nitrospinae bacterium]|nr:hypothetical protein [Nitrospinota bacterium]